MVNLKTIIGAAITLFCTPRTFGQTTSGPWKQCGGPNWAGPKGELFISLQRRILGADRSVPQQRLCDWL